MRSSALKEREVIVGLTSTASRLLGLSLRDDRFDLIDTAMIGLEKAIEGLDKFGEIAGCDSGIEYTTIALRQIVIWMQKRDADSAQEAFRERFETSDAEFCASMERAAKDVGFDAR